MHVLDTREYLLGYLIGSAIRLVELALCPTVNPNTYSDHNQDGGYDSHRYEGQLPLHYKSNDERCEEGAYGLYSEAKLL